MDKIWLVIMVLSLCFLLVGDPEKALTTMIGASGAAVNLSIKLLAVYAVWLGLIEIVKETKLSEKISSLLSPLIDLLFGKIENRAKEYVAMNMSFNMLGVGNAATPTGIKAFQELGDVSEKITAAMVMLLVINATSIQLLPTTIIGMRVTAGSANASDIIVPSLIATVASTVVGVVLVKMYYALKRKSGGSGVSGNTSPSRKHIMAQCGLRKKIARKTKKTNQNIPCNTPCSNAIATRDKSGSVVRQNKTNQPRGGEQCRCPH